MGSLEMLGIADYTQIFLRPTPIRTAIVKEREAENHIKEGG